MSFYINFIKTERSGWRMRLIQWFLSYFEPKLYVNTENTTIRAVYSYILSFYAEKLKSYGQGRCFSPPKKNFPAKYSPPLIIRPPTIRHGRVGQFWAILGKIRGK